MANNSWSLENNVSYVLKKNCIEAKIIRGDYEYEFFDDNLENYDPMATQIMRRPAYTSASWKTMGPMELPMTRYILTAYVKFNMSAGMSFQEFLAGSFPDVEKELV